MCCFTHDSLDYPGALASETVDDRCRCPCGPPPCRRRATEEDIRCDVCSGRVTVPEPYRMEPEPYRITRMPRRYLAEPELDRMEQREAIKFDPEWLKGINLPGVPPGKPGPAA
jgi:hypothetical protein